MVRMPDGRTLVPGAPTSSKDREAWDTERLGPAAKSRAQAVKT